MKECKGRGTLHKGLQERKGRPTIQHDEEVKKKKEGSNREGGESGRKGWSLHKTKECKEMT